MHGQVWSGRALARGLVARYVPILRALTVVVRGVRAGRPGREPRVPRQDAGARPQLTDRRRRRVGIVLWTLTFALPATAAWAMWTVSATGNGVAKARTASLTVTAGTAVAELYPGGPAGSVRFSVTNPNPFAVSLDSAALTAISSVSGGGGCTASDFNLATGAVSVSGTIAAGATTAITAPGVIDMKSTAGNGCQGVDVSVSGTVTASQV